MRIECYGYGFCIELPGAVTDLFDDGLMAAMDSVEVADGDDGFLKRLRGEFKGTEDLHGYISKGMRWPS